MKGWEDNTTSRGDSVEIESLKKDKGRGVARVAHWPAGSQGGQ